MVILDSLNESKEDRTIEMSTTSEQALALALPSINVDISVENAQTTIWPFSLPPICKWQQMGSLVNARQLVLKDLAYAIEKAWDKRVKQAAIVLMLRQLNQALNEPAPSAGPLRTFSRGRSFAERKQLLLTLWLGMLIGATVTAMGFLGVFFFLVATA